MGVFSTLIYSAGKPRGLGECLGVALLASLLCGLAILAFAIEGAVCIIMVLPIAGALAMFGAFVGYLINPPAGPWLSSGRLYAVSWVALPLLMVMEARLPDTAPPLNSVTTVCEIDATPELVWRHVVFW